MSDKGYTKGEKIFIKINQTSGRGRLTVAERAKGNYTVPVRPGLGTAETTPPIVLSILRQLINECGIAQADIAIGDPQNPTLGHNYDAWAAEFPNVKYVDRTFGTFGRTLIYPTKNDLLFYSDKYQTDKLYDIIENADYMINVANFKPHTGTGITLNAKNHFGSQSRDRCLPSSLFSFMSIGRQASYQCRVPQVSCSCGSYGQQIPRTKHSALCH